MSLCAEPPGIWSPGNVKCLEDQSSDSQARPYLSSLGVSEADNPGGGTVPSLLFLFDPFLCLSFGESPCLHLCRASKGENRSSENHHCLLTRLSCLSFLWSTKQSPLPATIRDLALAHHQRMTFGSFWIIFCFSCSLSFSSIHLGTLEWPGLPGILSVVPRPET